MEKIKGQAASEGISIGKIYVHQGGTLKVDDHKISDIDSEVNRFLEARTELSKSLVNLRTSQNQKLEKRMRRSLRCIRCCYRILILKIQSDLR